MELKVKLIDGSDHRISLDDQATLGALRAAVLEATNVAVERQRLIFRGKVLSDDSKLLSAIGVTDGNVLHMVERAPVLANAAPLAPHPDEQRAHHHHHPRAAVRNVIVGNLPIQRQPDFNEAHTRELLTSALGRIGDIGRTAGVRFEQDARTGDTHVHVQLRAERQTAVDSPARERVDH
uniref:Ubiquitin-like domain-containing protein n=1 Tax=Plectus sambesii TaxID=2011161 RepID=A0A914VV10_9BILA